MEGNSLCLQTGTTDGREKDTGPAQAHHVAITPPLTPAKNSTEAVEEAPWWQLGHHASKLGGALADLVNRPAVSPDVLNDAETRSLLPDSADEEQAEGGSITELINSPGSRPAPLVMQPPGRMTNENCTVSDFDMESAMILGCSTPSAPHQGAQMRREGMRGLTSRLMSRLQSRSQSPRISRASLTTPEQYSPSGQDSWNPDQVTNPDPHYTGKTKKLTAPGHEEASSQATEPAVAELPSTARNSEGIGNPWALTKDEEEKQRLIREAVVRELCKNIDHHRVEITESLVKATGDLGKNVVKHLNGSNADTESAGFPGSMLLDASASSAPNQDEQTGDAAAAGREEMRGWASGLMAKLRLQSRLNSPMTAPHGEESLSQDSVPFFPPDATVAAVANLPRPTQRREGVGDPFALTKNEEEEQRLMREAVVRDFAKNMDHHRLEITESLVKATGDLGKNFGKAGDKLLEVWDLNDLKDDTIEMKQHYEEDLKEDLGNIKEDLGKHVANVGIQLNTVKGSLGNIKDDLGQHVASVGLHLRIGGVNRLIGDISNMTTPRTSRASTPVAINRSTSDTAKLEAALILESDVQV